MNEKALESEYVIFSQAIEIMKEALERDGKRDLQYQHIPLQEAEEAKDFLFAIQQFRDFDPTPQYGEGEPAYSLREMHSVAYIDKQIAKGRTSHLYRVK